MGNYFSDSVSFLTVDCDYYVFTLAYDKKNGYHLRYEDKNVKEVLLNSSKLTICYIDGNVETINQDILSVELDDEIFKRRCKYGLEGFLFKYDIDSAIYYNLEVTKVAFDMCEPFVKKKTITNS